MRIYGDSRLIEDDKPWFVSDSTGNIEPSEKTAGKLLRSCFAVVLQSDKPDGFFDKFLSPIFVMYVQTAEIIDIFRYSQLIKNRYILQYDTNLLLDFVVVRRHFLSEDLDVALIIFQQRKSKSGLMGALADSVLEAGGHVTGVEPSFFIEAEFQHDGINDLIVTSDMAERKAKMIELGDAFIAFPGGTGTLEEIAEVMSAVSLGHLSAPCILYNLDGYYNDLKALLGHMIDKGLSSPRRQHGIYFADDLREIASIING